MNSSSLAGALLKLVKTRRDRHMSWLQERLYLKDLLDVAETWADPPSRMGTISGLAFFRPRFGRLQLLELVFSGCIFHRASFRDAHVGGEGAAEGWLFFQECRLRRADFRGISGKVNFENCDARNVDLRGVDVTGWWFSDVDLRGARLEGADFRKVAHVERVTVNSEDLLYCYIGAGQQCLVEALTRGKPALVADLCGHLLEDWRGTAGEALAVAEDLMEPIERPC